MFSHSKLIQTVKPKRRIDVISLTLCCNVDENGPLSSSAKRLALQGRWNLYCTMLASVLEQIPSL